MRFDSFVIECIIVSILVSAPFSTGAGEKAKQKKKKDVRDYTDADLERLLEEWDKDEEPLEPDELPEHLRPQPKIDLSNIDTSDPEAMLKASKKGRSLMMFVTVSGSPAKSETETITQLWVSALYNNHIEAQRFIIEDNRAIFSFKDGSQAWEAKDFVVKQERCEEVTIEGKAYPGKVAGKEKKKKVSKKTDL